MHAKKIFLPLMAMAIPMALQNIITFGVGLADNVMVGFLGDEALSAVFAANQLQAILQMFTLGIGAAIAVLASQHIGKGNVDEAKAVMSVGFYGALSVGVVLAVISVVAPVSVLGLFTNDEEVVAMGAGYLRIVAFSYVFFCIGALIMSSLRVVKVVRIGVLSSTTGLVVNIALNYVLIFGKFGFPAIGVAGAAAATLVSRVAETAIVCAYAFLYDQKLALKAKELFAAKRHSALSFLRHGTPVILGDILWGIGGAVQAAILGRLGVEALAANTIAGNLHQIFSVVVYGTAGAAGILVGQAVGRGNMPEIKTLALRLQPIFLGIGAVSGLLLFISRGMILRIAYPEISAEAHRLSLQFMAVLAAAIVGTSYQMSVLTGIVRAGGSTSFVLINDLIFVWLVVIPLGLLSAFVWKAPATVTFAVLKCDQILKCAVAYWKVHKWDWLKAVT
jgi:putative MATE family efflux protein